MATFDVHAFLTDCFLQRQLSIRPNLVLTPFRGLGSADIAEVMDAFGVKVLGQTAIPPDVKARLANHGADQRSTVVISMLGLEGPDRPQVVSSTQRTVMAVQNALSLFQKTRGAIAGVYVVRTDVDPYECYVEPRVLNTRQIRHLGPQNDDDVLWALTEEALLDPLVDTYLSLYGDVVPLGDGLRWQLSLETRLTKIWTLLETMAARLSRDERRNLPGGSRRSPYLDSVVSLYAKYEVGIRTIEGDGETMDLLDVAWLLRGIFAHAGSCSAVTSADLQTRCAQWGGKLEEVVESLEADCGHLLNSFIAEQIRERHPAIDFGVNRQLTTITEIKFTGEEIPPEVTELPGAARLARRAAQG